VTFTDQAGFDVRCEWGVAGIAALGDCRTFIVVDVLSFCTTVALAVERRVAVIPCRANDVQARELAERRGAVVAGRRGEGYSLSPQSLLGAPAGISLVLPSPNGATVTVEAARRGNVLAGCLRNRAAVCARAVALGGPIGIIPAGERWQDGTLRPALEDLLGAGAIAALLPGALSPEAAAARAAFEAAAGRLSQVLAGCSSGRELIERGFPEDVALASELDAQTVAAELVDGAFSASVQ